MACFVQKSECIGKILTLKASVGKIRKIYNREREASGIWAILKNSIKIEVLTSSLLSL